jgi:hypothetical protein
MRLRRQSAMYRDAAADSMTLAVELFNRPSRVPYRVQWRLGTDASTVVDAGLCR